MADDRGDEKSGAEAGKNSNVRGVQPDRPPPNRDRRREPPVIDLQAQAASPGDSATGTRRSEQNAPAPENRDAPAARRPSARLLGFAGLAALIVVIVAFVGGTAVGLLSERALTQQLQQEIGGLQARIAGLEDRSRDDVASARLSALDKRVAGLEANPAGASVASRLASIEKRLAAVEMLSGTLEALKHDAKDLKLAVDSAAAKAGAAQAAAMKLAERPAAPAAANPPTPAPAAVDLKPLTEQVGGIEKRVADAEARLAALAGELAGLRAGANSASTARAAGLAAVAQAILLALEQGKPYAADLEAAQLLGADPAMIDGLKAFAREGAPTAQALAAELSHLDSRSAPDQASAPAPGFLDTLVADTAGLVKVRRIDEKSKEVPPTALAGLAAALAHNDLQDALAQWEALPEAARNSAQALGNAMKARIAAQSAAAALLRQSIAALGRPKS